MTKKNNRTKKSKKNNNRNFAILAVVVLAVAVGMSSVFWGKGGEAKIPPAKTTDGRVVVLEFFDYG